MEKPRILCYNVDNDTLKRLTELCIRFSVKVIDVPFEDYGKPIAAVASGVFSEKNALAVSTLSESMAVFVSVPDAMLDVLLSAMRERAIKIPLKAVLTPYNAVWDANTLYNELCRERKEMSGK